MSNVDNNPGNGTGNEDLEGDFGAEALGASIFDDEDELDTDGGNDGNDDELEGKPEGGPEDIDDELEENDDDLEENDGDELGDDEIGEIDMSAQFKLPDGTITTAKTLHEGNMRQDDYTQKSQINADARRTIETERTAMQQTVQTERYQAVEIMKAVMPAHPPIDLLTTDPVEYQLQKALHEDAQQRIAAVQQQAGQAQAAAQEEHAARVQEFEAKEHASLLQMMPELQDPAKLATFKSSMLNTMTSKYGFEAAELGNISDHRIIGVMSDAAKWRALQDKKPAAKKKLQGKPPVMRGKPRTTPKQRRGKDMQTRVQKAAQTGNTKGVADFLGAYLDQM